MKKITQYLSLTAVIAALSIGQAFAGECCKKTAGQVKAGKACQNCVTHACCKEVAAKAVKEKNAKDCTVCAAKKDDKGKKKS